MYVAKMVTRYPDYHGKGYYNFIIDADRGWLEVRVQENEHDFGLVKIVKTRFKSVEAIMAKYPTKESLNERYFNVQV